MPAKILRMVRPVGLPDLLGCGSPELAQIRVEQAKDALTPSLKEIPRLAGFKVLANCAVAIFCFQVREPIAIARLVLGWWAPPLTPEEWPGGAAGRPRRAQNYPSVVEQEEVAVSIRELGDQRSALSLAWPQVKEDDPIRCDVLELLKAAPQFLAQLPLERVGLLWISWSALNGVKSGPPRPSGQK